jgi:predicted Fe-Mo cluster-binding NifX family protein
MKLAIPIWNDRVSSAFDFAHRLLLVDIERGHEIGRSEIPFPAKSDPEKVNGLKSSSVKVLICGAISRSLASQVRASGIKVLPYVVGQVDEVLKAYLAGRLIHPKYILPGSWPGARRGFCRRRRVPRVR